MEIKVTEYIKANKGKYSSWDVARHFKISHDLVSGIIVKAKLASYMVYGDSSLKEKVMDSKTKVSHDLSLSRLRDSKRETDSQYKVALSKVADLEREKQAILDIKSGVKSFTIKPRKTIKSEATPIWLASDWHVGEKVTYGQTNGINRYVLKIAQ